MEKCVKGILGKGLIGLSVYGIVSIYRFAVRKYTWTVLKVSYLKKDFFLMVHNLFHDTKSSVVVEIENFLGNIIIILHLEKNLVRSNKFFLVFSLENIY